MPEKKTSAPCSADPQDARSIASMFAKITPGYDKLNRILSGGLDIYWRKKLLQQLRQGEKGCFLDMAAGTMDVSVGIAKKFPQVCVLALDVCAPMLEEGRHKLAKYKVQERIFPVVADARQLPLPDGSVDCVCIAFGIRNIMPREQAYAEVLRVLTPSGRFCILEFGSGKRPIWFGLYQFYLKKILPVIGRLVSGDAQAYHYLADTIMCFPTGDELAAELQHAGFAAVRWQTLTSGIVCLHVADKERQI